MSPTALIVALPHEAKAILPLLRQIQKERLGRFTLYRALLAERPMLLLVTGMGETRAAEATELLCRELKPARLWASGYCGALSSHLKSGDLVIPEAIRKSGEPDLGLDTAWTRDFLPEQNTLSALLTVDRPVLSPEAKAELGRQFRAQAVDMESYAVVAVARRHALPLNLFRIVLDTADEALVDTQAFVDDEARVRPLPLLGALGRSPALLGQLLPLARLSRETQAQLRLAFSRIFSSPFFANT